MRESEDYGAGEWDVMDFQATCASISGLGKQDHENAFPLHVRGLDPCILSDVRIRLIKAVLLTPVVVIGMGAGSPTIP